MLRANPYEAAARIQKAMALLEELLRADIPSDLASLMDDEGWMVTARMAGVHPPSETTRAMVLDALRRAETRRTIN